MVVSLIERIYALLWGDLIHVPLPGGDSVGISLLIILLIPTGIYFTVRTKVLPLRLFPDMIRALMSKKENKDSLSTFQTLIVSTATRVGMGNLVGVVAAISAGGAGAVFWMWVTALIGSSTAFVEATLAQIHKEKDPLYGGYRGGPAYYIHHYMEEKTGKKKNHTLIAVLFAISGLICWCGISQVISNSVASSFENAFHIPPLYTTIVLVAVAAVIVLRKNATVKVLDLIVPIMAVCYFFITIFIILINMKSIPSVFGRIFEEAFGIRQVVSGGFGAVLMNGVKRGLFSNEAGSGSAPCAAAAAECDFPPHVRGSCTRRESAEKVRAEAPALRSKGADTRPFRRNSNRPDPPRPASSGTAPSSARNRSPDPAPRRCRAAICAADSLRQSETARTRNVPSCRSATPCVRFAAGSRWGRRADCCVRST